MAKSYITMKYEELKDKFNSFFLHKKKVKALENYASVVEFEGSKYIPILKEILVDGFMDDEEERFLDHEINKIEIDALAWSHKTKWIKSEMKRLGEHRAYKKPSLQLEFPFERLNPIPNMPYASSLVPSKPVQQRTSA